MKLMILIVIIIVTPIIVTIDYYTITILLLCGRSFRASYNLVIDAAPTLDPLHRCKKQSTNADSISKCSKYPISALLCVQPRPAIHSCR